jgi:signal transduction histidine kinase
VVADPELLRALLDTTVGNLVGHRHPDAACEIAVTVAPTDWGSELRITGNGPGIPAGQLGLVTSERIVAAHGGTLSITDTAGGGTTVCVRLPDSRGGMS